jgi:hypothetical protein
VPAARILRAAELLDVVAVASASCATLRTKS